MQITESAGAVTAPTGGRIQVRLIDAGVGSSGVYPAETLKRAAEESVFAKGLHLFSDHPTETERFDRPERSIRDIAGVLTEDARYDEPTQSLVAEAKLFGAWAPVIAEMHEDIGLSIRAAAEVSEAEDGTRVIERITEAQSCDFVTRAGRGGRVLSLLESARASHPTVVEATSTDPTHVPVIPAGRITHTSEEDDMAQIEESRLRAQLDEATGRVQTLTTERDTARTEATEATKRAETAERALHESRNTETARRIIGESGHPFTALEQRGLMADMPLTDAGQLDEAAFATAVKAAVDEAAMQVAEHRVTGFGSIQDVPSVTESDIDAVVASAFGRTIKEA